MPFSPGGNGLFLVSLTAVVEELGVPWFEELGEWVDPWATSVDAVLGEGEEVPEVPSFLFFLLPVESLVRESCSDYVSEPFRNTQPQERDAISHSIAS